MAVVSIGKATKTSVVGLTNTQEIQMWLFLLAPAEAIFGHSVDDSYKISEVRPAKPRQTLPLVPCSPAPLHVGFERAIL